MVALFSAGNASNLFLLLRARELGVGGRNPSALGGRLGGGDAGLHAPVGLVRPGGTKAGMGGGYLAYGLFYLLMASLHNGGPWLLALFGFYGLFMAATEGVEKALVADLAPPSLRGTAFGWFNMTTALMLLPASLVFGWIYQAAGPSLAFVLAGSCALGAAALLAVWMGPTMTGSGKG